ncbi:24162_t:CDS:2, partial [Gigaspora rosea]
DLPKLDHSRSKERQLEEVKLKDTERMEKLKEESNRCCKKLIANIYKKKKSL